MKMTINQYILDKQTIAYLIADQKLQIQTWSGDITLANLDDGMTIQHAPLAEVIPELVGLEEPVLHKILDGTLDNYHLDFVTRPKEDKLYYLNMVVLPHQPTDNHIEGVILVMSDATRLGLMLQELTQQRNELRLLREKYGQCTTQLEEKTELQAKIKHTMDTEFEQRLSSTTTTLETLLRGTNLNDTQRTALEHVDETIHRLVAVAQQLSKIMSAH